MQAAFADLPRAGVRIIHRQTSPSLFAAQPFRRGPSPVLKNKSGILHSYLEPAPHVSLVLGNVQPQRLGARKAAACGAGMVSPGGVAAQFDISVISVTLLVSLKLVLLCSCVGWMMASKRLPPTTPQVLSQVSCRYTVHCPHFLTSSRRGIAHALGSDGRKIAGFTAVLHMRISWRFSSAAGQQRPFLKRMIH